jgi:hypothetical protein
MTHLCSFGGGYLSETDTYKFSEAVELRRKFIALPDSWSIMAGDGAFNVTVMYRHFGVLSDPWELFFFWRFMGAKERSAADREGELESFASSSTATSFATTTISKKR